jgi:uncharacterized protein with PIN domain
MEKGRQRGSIHPVTNVTGFLDPLTHDHKEVVARARTVHGMGVDTFDALHLACAERSVDIFLTTDDTLIKSIKKHADKITIRVKNPVQWFMEVTANGSEDAQ